MDDVRAREHECSSPSTIRASFDFSSTSVCAIMNERFQTLSPSTKDTIASLDMSSSTNTGGFE